MGLNHSPSIVTSNLVLCLDAGNIKSYPGSGTVWTNLSRVGNNGTLVNGVGYSSTNRGSLVFDGSNDHVVISANSAFNFGTGDVTISAWIYWDGTYMDTGREIYATGGSGSLDQFGIFNGFGLVFGGVANNIAANYPPVNSWSFVCASKIGTNIKIYVNGVETASGNQSSSIGSSSVPAYIGIRGADNYHPFKGNIAAFCLYNGKGLTAQEVLQNFNALRGRFGI